MDDQIHSTGFAHISFFLLQWFLYKKNNSERNFVYFCNNSLEFEIVLFVPFEFQKVNLLSKKLCIQSLQQQQQQQQRGFLPTSPQAHGVLPPHKHMVYETQENQRGDEDIPHAERQWNAK